MTVVVDWVQAHLGFLPPQVLVVIVSMLPVIELRGGIPLARLLMLPLWQAIVFSAIGNILPIPFILLFIKKIFEWLSRFGPTEKIVRKLEDRAAKKSDALEKGEFLGLMLFVGIPLPGTGGWTGSLIAALLDVDFKKALVAEILGILIATVIMSIVSYGLLAQLV